MHSEETFMPTDLIPLLLRRRPPTSIPPLRIHPAARFASRIEILGSFHISRENPRNLGFWNRGYNPAAQGQRLSKSAPFSLAKPLVKKAPSRAESFHKVPVGDTPYVKAKHVQLVDKDPDRAIALFWAAINAGDRVDSALKDMAIVLKQQNRPEEAIEAIKSLRNRFSDQAQESLDNVLLDLYKGKNKLSNVLLSRKRARLYVYGFAVLVKTRDSHVKVIVIVVYQITDLAYIKSDFYRAICPAILIRLLVFLSLSVLQRCGRLDDQIALLKHKLNLIRQGLAFNGRKTARSQGKKFQVSIEQRGHKITGKLGISFPEICLFWFQVSIEQKATRLRGNLGWVYSKAIILQQSQFTDNNKMCNLRICLMIQGRVSESLPSPWKHTPHNLSKNEKPSSDSVVYGATTFLATSGFGKYWAPVSLPNLIWENTEEDTFGDENMNINSSNVCSSSLNRAPFGFAQNCQTQQSHAESLRQNLEKVCLKENGNARRSSFPHPPCSNTEHVLNSAAPPFFFRTVNPRDNDTISSNALEILKKGCPLHLTEQTSRRLRIQWH
eukprot:Gb_30001 [translate_table: standard]